MDALFDIPVLGLFFQLVDYLIVRHPAPRAGHPRGGDTRSPWEPCAASFANGAASSTSASRA